jgi:hypothetical protein
MTCLQQLASPDQRTQAFPNQNLYHKEATLLTYTKKKEKKKGKKKKKERQLYAARNDKVKWGS